MDTSFGYDSCEENLLQELRAAAAEVACVPARCAAAAKATFTWHAIEEELQTVALCFDSAVDGQALVRSPATVAPRTLSFECDEFGLEVEIRPDYITGQLLPPHSAVLRLRAADGSSRRARADLSGWFVFDRTMSGPQRLECHLGKRVLATEWTIW